MSWVCSPVCPSREGFGGLRGDAHDRGSRWFANGSAQSTDSIHVGRLRKAGAIPIGKTATPEFGAWAYTASPLLASPATRGISNAHPADRARFECGRLERHGSLRHRE